MVVLKIPETGSVKCVKQYYTRLCKYFRNAAKSKLAISQAASMCPVLTCSYTAIPGDFHFAAVGNIGRAEQLSQ